MTPSATALLRRLVVLGAPPWRKLALSCLLGVAAAMATLGLLAGSGYLVDRAAFAPGLSAIAGLLALVEVMAFIRAPLRYGERLTAHDAAMQALVRWRVWLFDLLEPLAPAGLRNWRSGDLLRRAIDDVDALQDLYLRGLTPVAVAVCTSTLAIVVVSILLPPAGLVLGVALAVALVVPATLALVNGSSEAREAEMRGELAAEVVDLAQGSAELLAFGRADEALDRIETTDATVADLARRRGLVGAWASAVVAVCAGGAAVGVLAVSVQALRDHRLSTSLVAALPLAAIAAFETVPPVTMAAHRVGGLLAAGRRLLAIEATPPPVVDPPQPDHLPTGHDIVLERARLRYEDHLPWALDGFSMNLGAGERVALIGPSGAGKSTVVNVLMRFWGLQEGQASLGGVPLDRLAQADVRRVIALVDQDARLFAGTIRTNVTLARPDANDEEVRRALELAQLGTWVDSLPDGVDTSVGEQGAQVSGGQRQRIALARALLTDSPVLVLDEPTAGLDQPTAAALLRDVLGAAGGRSVLLITHHEEDVGGCDRTIEIEAGHEVTGG